MAAGTITSYFASKIYRAETASGGGKRLLANLEAACQSIAEDDAAGQNWCRTHAYPGYTSYASLNDLPQRFPEFADLAHVLSSHINAFSQELELDLDGRGLELDSLWINVLPEGGFHTAHIHPHSVISGTYYVQVPKGASAIRFEDPRHAMMMAAPPRKAKAKVENRAFISLDPKPGTLLLWESYLRHDVPINRAKGERVSVSFNFRWA